MAAPQLLGNLVRLVPLQLNDLPFHSALAAFDNPKAGSQTRDNTTEGGHSLGTGYHEGMKRTDQAYRHRPKLEDFLKAILDEAITFVDDTIPKTFKTSGNKSSSPAVAKVELMKREIPGAELTRSSRIVSKIPRNLPENIRDSSEVWFARRSSHANSNIYGTADFSEFDHGLRLDHSEKEREYTPDVYDSYKVLDWDSDTAQDGFKIDGYSEVTMRIYEMCHKLPFPLLPRVFPVLVVTAKIRIQSFVIVQIPVDIVSLPQSFYSNERNLMEGKSALKRKRVVLGIYTSIECCRIAPDQNIEWTMATASDAKGWLPMWAQKMGVPGAVAKDVGLFIKWVSGGRGEDKS